MNNLNLSSVIIYFFTVIYLGILILISVIDRKERKIDKNVLSAGIILSIFYMIYLYIADSSLIYNDILYLGIYIILLVLDTILLRKYAKDSYIVKILMLLNFVFIFTEIEITVFTITAVTIAVIVQNIIYKLTQKRYGNKKMKLEEIPLGFFIGVSNILILVVSGIFNMIG